MHRGCVGKAGRLWKSNINQVPSPTLGLPVDLVSFSQSASVDFTLTRHSMKLLCNKRNNNTKKIIFLSKNLTKLKLEVIKETTI